MAVDAIGLTPSTASTTTSSASNISQDDFLRILLTQLKFQDPLKPVDEEQFVAQLAQFSALEITRQQSDKIDSLLTIDSTDQAVSLLGKTVQAGADQNNAVGTVSAISFATGEPQLTITASDNTTLTNISLSDVTLVR